MKTTFLLLLLIPLLARAASPDLQADLDSLVSAERAFSKTSEEQGIKAAFLAFMAEDSVLFRPGPVLGRPWTEERPAPPGLLTWYPIKADIAKSGELGYTTGPWELRPKGKDDPEVRHGNYVTVWRKREDGSWKMVTDIGNVNPKPTSVETGSLRLDPAEIQSREGAESPQAAEASVLAADRAFNAEAQHKGVSAAYAQTLADDSRLLRNGFFPLAGKEAIRSHLASQNTRMSWVPAQAGTSLSGDLGYTYGSYEQAPADPAGEPEKGHYLRIWKKQTGGAWKLVLDILNPLPPPPAPEKQQ